MTGAIEAWLQRRWYGGETPGPGLRAVAGMYRLAAGLARRHASPVSVGVPVLVVGNFTAGGAGKTPLVIALAAHLRARGWRPGIVSRGHGRRSNEPVRVGAASTAAEAGDEPLLLHRRTGLPVFVDADRVAAARSAVAAGCDLVLADDGLQHRRLARDLEIEVLDGGRGYGNGLLLPAGPLREAPRPCDLRVVTVAEAQEWPAAGAGWPMSLALSDQVVAVDASVDPARRPLRAFTAGPVVAIAGIGNPARFFDALRARGLQVDGRAFADHHAFTAAELEDLPRPLLMTEKDAVKCRTLGLRDAWAVPADATLPAGFFAALDAALPAGPRHD
jgi:tetraacyldisaccharide 4'-kinase